MDNKLKNILKEISLELTSKNSDISDETKFLSELNKNNEWVLKCLLTNLMIEYNLGKEYLETSIGIKEVGLIDGNESINYNEKYKNLSLKYNKKVGNIFERIIFIEKSKITMKDVTIKKYVPFTPVYLYKILKDINIDVFIEGESIYASATKETLISLLEEAKVLKLN